MSRLLDLWAGMTGTVLDFAGTAAPNGWLMCYGQAVNRATYPNLFAKIGTTFGAGDGSTTFNLPDTRGRAAIGKDDMGGTAANRVTTAAGGVDAKTLGATGGASTHTLTAAQIPAHAHTMKYTSATYTSGSGTNVQTLGGAGAQSASTENNTGGDGAHPNVQPGIVFNKIIRC